MHAIRKSLMRSINFYIQKRGRKKYQSQSMTSKLCWARAQKSERKFSFPFYHLSSIAIYFAFTDDGSMHESWPDRMKIPRRLQWGFPFHTATYAASNYAFNICIEYGWFFSRLVLLSAGFYHLMDSRFCLSVCVCVCVQLHSSRCQFNWKRGRIKKTHTHNVYNDDEDDLFNWW